MISYSAAQFHVRSDIVDAHRHAWHRLSRPGAWLDGATRLAVAAEVRQVSRCELCERRKQALSASSVSGRHDDLGQLPAPVVEQIHAIVSDPARLTRKWFGAVLDSGLSDTEYVEIVGVVATVVSIDTFCRAVGVPVHSLPQPEAGAPHRRRPRTAHQRGEAWVPMIHPGDLKGELETEEERVLERYWGGMLANIRRALSLVPEEAFEWFQLVETQYLPGKWMWDFANEYRAITHAQIELIAGRVSVLNRCFY